MTYDLNTPSVVRLWNYTPDWSSPFEVTRAFKTDIAGPSRSNMEQRRALRDAARLSARYRTVVQDADLQSANHFLRAWQNKPTAVTDFTRYAVLTGSSAVDDTALTLASPPAWVAAGQLLALCGTAHELVEVDSLADPTITLAGELVNGWASGSILRPVLHGLLTGQMSSSRYHRGAAQLSVQIVAYPGGEPPEDEGTATTTFNGYEVFPPIEPNWAATPALDYLWPVEQVDYGIGRTAQFRPIEAAQRLVEAEFAGLAPSAAQAIEQAFLRAKGRRGAFYRPTTEQDFTLAANTSAVAYFDAVGTDLYDDFGAVDYAANPAAIEIVKTDGTRTHKLITGITLVSGKSRVAFSGALTLTTASTARISWMPLVRFASDEMTTAWRTPLSATIRTTFQSIRA